MEDQYRGQVSVLFGTTTVYCSQGVTPCLRNGKHPAFPCIPRDVHHDPALMAPSHSVRPMPDPCREVGDREVGIARLGGHLLLDMPYARMMRFKPIPPTFFELPPDALVGSALTRTTTFQLNPGVKCAGAPLATTAAPTRTAKTTHFCFTLRQIPSRR